MWRVLQDFAASDIKCVAYMALKRGERQRQSRIPGMALLLSCAAITRSMRPS
jgi:hypothetical protein